MSGFMASLEHVATQEMPKIDSLARSALDGISRAYDLHADPAQTAENLVALRAALVSLYDMLKESGLGALPLNPSDPSELLNPAQGGDPRLEVLTEQVNAIFKEGKNSRERATVVVDMLQAQQNRGVQRLS